MLLDRANLEWSIFTLWLLKYQSTLFTTVGKWHFQSTVDTSAQRWLQSKAC